MDINSKNYSMTFILNAIIAVLVTIFCYISGNDNSKLNFVGILIIILSAILIYRCRNNKMLFFLIITISFINISISIYDLLLRGVNTTPWQINGLRSTSYNCITAKTILLFISYLNLLLKKDVISKVNISITNKKVQTQDNKIISMIGIVFLYLLLVYAFFTQVLTRSAGNYQSVSSAIFEYGVLIYIISWYYSNDRKRIKCFLLLFVIIYSLMFLYIGDRSSVFMYLVATYLIFFQDLFSGKKLLLFFLVGIFLANVISITRISDSFNINNIITSALTKGLYVDTFSWSYYTGIALVALSYMTNERLLLSIYYFLSFFGIHNNYSDFGNYISIYYNSTLFNRGGGLFTPYMFMYGGFIGVIISVIILSLIINKIFKDNNGQKIIYKYAIIAMSLRWYLYNPITLFRGILIILPLILFACKLFDKSVKKAK